MLNMLYVFSVCQSLGQSVTDQTMDYISADTLSIQLFTESFIRHKIHVMLNKIFVKITVFATNVVFIYPKKILYNTSTLLLT